MMPLMKYRWTNGYSASSGALATTQHNERELHQVGEPLTHELFAHLDGHFLGLIQDQDVAQYDLQRIQPFAAQVASVACVQCYLATVAS